MYVPPSSVYKYTYIRSLAPPSSVSLSPTFGGRNQKGPQIYINSYNISASEIPASLRIFLLLHLLPFRPRPGGV